MRQAGRVAPGPLTAARVVSGLTASHTLALGRLLPGCQRADHKTMNRITSDTLLLRRVVQVVLRVTVVMTWIV